MKDLIKLLLISLCLEINFATGQRRLAAFARTQKNLPYDLMTNSDDGTYNGSPFKIIFYESAVEPLLPRPTFAPSRSPPRFKTTLKPRWATKQPVLRDDLGATRKPPPASSTRKIVTIPGTTGAPEPEETLPGGQFFVPFKKTRQDELLHKNSPQYTSTN